MKRFFAIGALFIGFGIILFAIVMSFNQWDFSILGSASFETNTHEITEDFSTISIECDTEDVKILPAEDGISKVVCFEEKNQRHGVAISEGKMSIKVVDERKWYEYISIYSPASTVTVYLAQSEYDSLFIKSSTGDVEISNGFTFRSIDISASTSDVENYSSATESMKIQLSTGDITVENASAGSLSLKVSTGHVTLTGISCSGDVDIEVGSGKTEMSDVKCANLISTGGTGDITMNNLVAAQKINITRGTGDVRFEDSDALEVEIKTSTGDVKGTFLTEKVFIVNTSTGKIKVPESVSGGKCKVTTGTGDVKISIRVFTKE